MTSIPQRSVHDDPADLAKSLDDAGCLVVTGMLDEAGCASVREELASHLGAAPVATSDDPKDFYPGNTRRVTALMARSATAREMTLHPTTQALCQHHLGANCERYQLHVTAALEVGPGARSQILHREEDPFTIFPLPRPNLILASMTAISEFTKDNGGTLLVPGSHRWDANRKPEPNEIVAAEMPAGSVLYWLGGTLHGAGANVSDGWRYGVILTYSVGWVRQEENQFLDIPPAAAATMSQELLELTGRTMCGALGFFDPRVPGEG